MVHFLNLVFAAILGLYCSEVVVHFGATFATIEDFESLRPKKWVTSNVSVVYCSYVQC